MTTPIVQIVHVSDLHIDHADPAVVQARDDWKRFVSFLSGRLPASTIRRWDERWEQGTAGHDPSALDAFEDAAKILRHDSRWNKVPTWLIDSGDLTTFGDALSLRKGADWLRQFSGDPFFWQVYKLHGNHDAWPVMFPLMAASSAARRRSALAHRGELRDNWYTSAHPREVFCTPVPPGQHQVQLFSMNSALHDWDLNSLALGEVCHDQWWRNGAAPKNPVQQVMRLKALIPPVATMPPAHGCLRVGVLHHPVVRQCYRGDVLAMRLLQRERLNRHLHRAHPNGAEPLFHIYLSGHTHRTYPDIGALAATRNPPPLSQGQKQLVVGSLSQMPMTGSVKDDNDLQQFQVLRVSEASSSAREFVVERLVYVRPANVGSFILRTPVESFKAG